ncbi:MAG: 23S rRNA (guanosine(2251)-2'-O)-methyltransferase RlmB [Acidimicrobiia bacterium]|nr:23S rRNA (guanosine(2251)-2'-O)-methyltransferase RlmB [Acidimicrobiia bacterium]
MWIYGINAVRSALHAGRVREILLIDRDSGRLTELATQARSLDVPIRSVAAHALERHARGGVHQGVVARVDDGPAPVTLGDLVRGQPGNPPLIVVLDGVEDPQNLGAILRTVDAAGASGLVRQTRRSARLDGAAAKAAAGAAAHVPVVEVVNIARTLEVLKDAGVWTVGLAGDAPKLYTDLDLTVPTALVLGAEGTGLRRLVRERCDWVVAIPMAGHVGSLNVSVAAGVALFEAVRQRRLLQAGPFGPR